MTTWGMSASGLHKIKDGPAALPVGIFPLQSLWAPLAAQGDPGLLL